MPLELYDWYCLCHWAQAVQLSVAHYHYYMHIYFCHLISQDFPSIYQVREKLIENDIITIFAVAENITDNLLSTNDVYSVSQCDFSVCACSVCVFSVGAG